MNQTAAEIAGRLVVAQETTVQLLDRILEKKEDFLARFERVEAKLADLDARVTALWYAPNMPGEAEAKAYLVARLSQLTNNE